MVTLASACRTGGMLAYSELHEIEFASEEMDYTATRYPREVGTYFALVREVISCGTASTAAESTEVQQFHHATAQ